MTEKVIELIIGFPGSGKTRFSKRFEDKGFLRLNRDELGGSLNDLVNIMEEEYKGQKIHKFVLDNTYSTQKQRKSIIQWAIKNDFQIKCNWLQTDVSDSHYNISKRMIENYGTLLMPEDIKKNKKDPGVYPPGIVFIQRKSFEKPKLSEGFKSIKKIPFKREIDKTLYKNRALILDYDGTLRKTKSGSKYPLSIEDVEILPNRAKTIKKYVDQGYYLLGVSNQSGIAKGELSKNTAIEIFEYTNSLLKLDIDYRFCPHKPFPQICYCRKPIPGIAVELIEQYKLDPPQCIMVGDMKSDETFAKRAGFSFIYADKFFAKHQFKTLEVF